MTDNTIELDEELIDKFCWQMVFSRNNWFPPEESAEKCVEGLDDPDDNTIAHEEGYHAAGLVENQERIEDFGAKLKPRSSRDERIQAVEKRAKRYAEASDGLTVPKTWDELKDEYESD